MLEKLHTRLARLLLGRGQKWEYDSARARSEDRNEPVDFSRSNFFLVDSFEVEGSITNAKHVSLKNLLLMVLKLVAILITDVGSNE